MSAQQGDKKKSFFSEWLEKLQQESWQLELLISGFALFGIWASRDIINQVSYYIQVYMVDSALLYSGLFMIVCESAWYIFFVNLIIHIIVRGLWIGAIGLRYVSGDIDF